MGFEHWCHGVTEIEIRITDDPRAGPKLAITAAGTHGRDTIDELGLADRLHRLGSVGPVHGRTLDKNRGHHIVTTDHVGQQLIEQITAIGMIPKVMVRIADQSLGLDDVLLDLCQPDVAVHQ